MDLLKSFQPSWVKDSGSAQKPNQIAGGHSENRRDARTTSDYDESDSRWQRKPPKSDRIHRRHGDEPSGKGRRPSDDKRAPGGRPASPRDRRSEAPERRGADMAPSRETVLTGWTVKFVAEPRGVEGLIKQIKANAKACGLFELARLVLEKSPRYLVAFQRTNGPQFFQCVADGTLWLSESAAVDHALSVQRDTLYRCEREEIEAPKGVYPVIAQCGMSGVLLGPPNHHDYQLNLRKLHSERFSNVPFDIFKARIRMLRDEESINKWRTEQSTREVYFTAQVAEGEEPEKLSSQSELQEHFQKHHAGTAVINPGDSFTVPGPVAVNDSALPILDFVRHELDGLIRFPLPLAHVLGQELAAGGLQIFKAHENVTYVSVARPKALDRQANPVSESLSAILDYLESNGDKPRAEQWAALLELQKESPEGDPAARETALRRDLYWLLHQGQIIDFASKGFEVPRRNPSRPQQERKPKTEKLHKPAPVPAVSETPQPPAE